MSALRVLAPLFALVLLAAPAFAAEIAISSFYGKYDTAMKQPGQQATSLRGPKMETWTTPEKANEPYTIGVSFPHLKDSYWLAVNHGIVDEARSIGVGIRLVEAGGYDNLPTQQAQLTELAQAGVDGIILGSISYTGNNDIVAALAEDGVPVIEVINDIEAGAIAAKALVSFYDMGFFAGEHVAAQAEAEDKDAVSVLFLPGPKGSGWADDTLVGFQAATEFAMADITLLDVKWGDTGAKAQSELLVEALAAHPEVDYIVGNAVAADVAVDILQQAERSAKIVSTYITPPVYDHIREGDIEAAPADMTVDQARIAVGMMVRLLNGEEPGKDFPFRAGPLIPVVTRTSIGEISYERLFGPRDFTPVFEMKP